MNTSKLIGQRRVIGLFAAATIVLGVYWVGFSAGMPVWWGPSASATDIAAGQKLFEHEWQPNDPLAHGDGLGPVFNATSCVECHFQGGVGGGGEISHNATHYEVMPNPRSEELLTGTLHKKSVLPADKESFKQLRKRYPVVQIRPPADLHCGSPPPPVPFDPVSTHSVQSTAMFGAGWIDRISEKAILQNHRRRAFQSVTAELSLNFEGVPVGRVRVLPDGSVGRFGWKAQQSRLRDFVATACADEIGLGTPHRAETLPFSRSGATEAGPPDLDRTQFKQLLAFVDTLPRPVERTDHPQAARGKQLFTEVGCAICHVPNMGGVKGVYTDFLLYTLSDPLPPGGGGGGYGAPTPPPEFPRPDREPRREEWKTPPLWGVASSAPYMHDGSAQTLADALQQHRGDANSVRVKFEGLPAADQAALLAFLESLTAPPSAESPRYATR